MRNVFIKIFEKRCAVCFFVLSACFFGCILRVASAAVSDYSEVQKTQSSLRLTVCRLRGTIYDRNMVPLTNSQRKIIAAVSPTPRAVTAISSVLDGKELESVLERLKSGKPTLCEVPELIECDGIACTEIYDRTCKDIPAVHIIGYLNGDFHGETGLEGAYDDLLYSDESAEFVYTKNGKGDILAGLPPEVVNNTSVTANGVVSTLDINIQNAAERASEKIERGAVIVAESSSNKIRAMVSRPDFDPQNVAAFLDDSTSPLLNRCLCAYNVGSAFKPCIAAAGAESGKLNFAYTCTGSCKIIDRFFKCHKLSGHGYMNLENAIANSCNTYFYNFGISAGAENIYKTAANLGFGKSVALCEKLRSAPGSLPEPERLTNQAQLANLSIGQGELLLAPVAMLNLYSAIASGGSYYNPSVTEATVTDGKKTPYNNGGAVKAMEKSTADFLKKSLVSVITDGTGSKAAPKTVTAAGKTATAQTGKYENGVEICQGWFCGFFPAENPKYTVIVFSENINRESTVCAEVFADIADKINELHDFKINGD